MGHDFVDFISFKTSVPGNDCGALKSLWGCVSCHNYVFEEVCHLKYSAARINL